MKKRKYIKLAILVISLFFILILSYCYYGLYGDLRLFSERPQRNFVKICNVFGQCGRYVPISFLKSSSFTEQSDFRLLYALLEVGGNKRDVQLLGAYLISSPKIADSTALLIHHNLWKLTGENQGYFVGVRLLPPVADFSPHRKEIAEKWKKYFETKGDSIQYNPELFYDYYD